jgi:hypothetical protein
MGITLALHRDPAKVIQKANVYCKFVCIQTTLVFLLPVTSHLVVGLCENKRNSCRFFSYCNPKEQAVHNKTLSAQNLQHLHRSSMCNARTSLH